MTFLSLFQNDVYADTTSKLVLNGIWDISATGSLGPDGSTTMLPVEKEEVNGVEYNYYYRTLSRCYLYNPKPEAYAYKIILTNNMGNEMNYNSMLIWGRPIVGTFSEITRGDWTIFDGNVLNSCETSRDVVSTWGWYETNGSIEPIELYVGLYCRSYGDQTTGNTVSAYVDFSAEITVQIFEYSKSDYEAELSKSMDEQNQISEKQLDEAEKQTELQQEHLEQAKEQTSLQEDILKETEEQTEAQKNFFSSFFDNLKNAVIGLFVPSSDEMSDIWNDFTAFFENHFGFLYSCFGYLTSFFNILMAENNHTALYLPGFEWQGMTVWSPMEFDITSYGVVNDIFGYIRIVTGFLLSLFFINYLRNFFERRFGGGGS